MQALNEQRQQQRLNFARFYLQRPDLELERASSDASFRSYWRTRGVDPSFIVMDAPPPQEDLQPWMAINKHLAEAGIHVPRIHSADPAQGLALIEDLGAKPLLSVLDEASVDAHYAHAMTLLFELQSKVSTQGLPAYDAALLREELDLVIPWFLQQHLQHALNDSETAMLDNAFTQLVDSALEQPRVFVHRDYHSRNLMLMPDQRFGLIDFQDAVNGPITYDLVSLLRDCYITWDEAKVRTWCEAYRQQLIQQEMLDAETDQSTFQRWFDWMGLQRHIKVLGIFSRLAIRDGKPGYLPDLPRVLDYVLRISHQYPEFSDLHDFFEDVTRGHDLTQIKTG